MTLDLFNQIISRLRVKIAELVSHKELCCSLAQIHHLKSGDSGRVFFIHQQGASQRDHLTVIHQFTRLLN